MRWRSIALLLLGCGTDPVSAGLDLAEARVDTICDCFDARGFPSREACVSMFEASQATEEERACIRDAYDSSLDEWAECALREAESLDACLNEATCAEATECGPSMRGCVEEERGLITNDAFQAIAECIRREG